MREENYYKAHFISKLEEHFYDFVILSGKSVAIIYDISTLNYLYTVTYIIYVNLLNKAEQYSTIK